MKIIYSLFFISIFLSCKAQKAPILTKNNDGNTLLWEVSGNGLKVPTYLFGTFHMLCKSDIVFSSQLQQALAYSKQVYFEMDLDDPKNTLGAVFFMNMKNSTLKDLYTVKEYQKVKSYFKDTLGMGLELLQKWKPSLLEAMLYPRMMPCKNASGVELELMDIAVKQKKEILGLETIEFQTSVFDSIPYQIQANALLKTIDSIAAYKVYFEKMVQVYKNQQIEKLQEIISDTTFSEGLNNDIMLKNRNQNWVIQLQKIMPLNNVFVAVGAAHLFGKDGLIKLFLSKGYTVTPLMNK